MPRICYVEKRFNRKSAERIRQANEIIVEYQAQGFDLTLRQLYYQFVSRDLIPNTDRSYDNLGALISDARLAGLIDWDAIQDRTRNLRANSHWDNPESIVETCSRQFRVDRWENQVYRPEVWIEKDALIGVIEGVCHELDVPYFSCRGYTSQSEMWRAGRRLKEYVRNGQMPMIFHMGDHDPSGIDMTRDITDRLKLFAGRSITVERIALNMDQIRQYDPPPNPAKVTDSRFEAYRLQHGDESWELDALEPSVMVDLIRGKIEEVTDETLWTDSGDLEEQGREQLTKVAKNWDGVLEHLS